MNRSITYKLCEVKKLLFMCSFVCVCCFAVGQPCTPPTVTVLKKEVCQNENIYLTFTGTSPFTLDYTFNGTRQTITISGTSTTLAATQLGKNVLIVNELIDGNGCSTGNSDDGVEINGLLWAKYNVDKPNTFAANPEDAGMFYRWNSKIGWSTSNPLVSYPVGSVWIDDWNGNSAMAWETANNVCPAGWKIPVNAELQSLMAAAGQWTSINGVAGRMFGSGNNTIFLPAAGDRNGWDSGNLISAAGVFCYYWGSVGSTDMWGNLNAAFGIHTMKGENNVTLDKFFRNVANNIRCVKDIPQATITVYPTKKETITATICKNETYLFNGKYYNTTGEYTAALKTSFGCDSIVTLKLTVDESCGACTPPTVTIAKKEVCQNENIRLVFTGEAPFILDYEFNGVRRKITVFGMDTAFVATQVGKNVFIVYDLISDSGCSLNDTKDGVEINGIIWAKYNVDAPNTFTKNPEDFGMFYQWGRSVGWSSTNPLVSSPAGNTWTNFCEGHDGVIIYERSNWESSNDVCPIGWRIPTLSEQQNLINIGHQWTTKNGVDGRLFGSGDNSIFLPAAGARNGLDGTFLTITIFVEGVYWSSQSSILYAAHALDFWENGFNPSMYMSNTHHGHDTGMSVRCVKDTQKDTITVHPTKKETITKVICSNETYLFNGNNYNETGIYTDTLKTSFGCDSIVMLKLTVNPAFDLQETITICDSELPLVFRDTTFRAGTQSGNYVFNRKTVNGCDSITTLKLTVNPTFDLQETIILCDDIFPFTFRDITFEAGTAEGTYVFNRTTVTGCDSTVTFNLTYNTNFTEQITLCNSELPFTFRDITFEAGTVSGDYVFNRTSLYGCDSIVTLKLTVNETFTTYDTITLYDDDLPFTYLGMTFSHGSYSGDYVFNPRTTKGCDSIIHLNLTIHQTLRQTICDSELPTFIRDTWFPQGTQSGVYVVDKGLTTLILTVNPTPEFTIGNPDAILKIIYTRPIPPIDTSTYINNGNNNGNNNNTILKSGDIISCTNAEYENVVAGNFSPPFNANASLQWTIIYENGERYVLPDKTLQTLLADTVLFPYVGAYRVEALYQYQSNGRVCASATAVVDYAVFDPPRSPIVATQKTMCEGELSPLQAFGSPLIQWISSDKKLHDWVGETYDFERLGLSDIPLGTYEFELFDTDALSGCESERVQLSFEVAPAANPQIVGRNEFCLQAIEEMYAVKTAAQGSDYFWRTSGNHYNYSKDGNPYSPSRYVDWYGVGIDTVSVYERTYAGCEGYDTLVVFIADYPVPFYTWNLPGAGTAIEFIDSSFQAPIIAKNPDGTQVEIPLTYTMEWFFDTNNNRDTAVVDMFVEYHNRFNPIQIENYTYGYKYPILAVTNNFGCRASYSTEIFIDIPNGIYIPNAFSPTNAAASVRIFKPVAYNLEYCKVWIYDKWGNLLWYSNEVQNGVFTGAWDGVYNGELLQSDVYIWKIEAKFLDGTTWAGQKKSVGGYSRFGSVVLVR